MTQAQARDRFLKLRAQIVRFAAETDAPLKQGIVDNSFFVAAGPKNSCSVGVEPE
jgi:hypothetical protein